MCKRLNKLMKILKTVLVLMVVMTLIMTASAQVWALEKSTPKEEVVYVMTDGAGTVSDIEVVNIFTNGEVVDHGDYSKVQMMTTENEVKVSGDTITFSAGTEEGEKVYCQGTLKNKEMPWKISIKYDIDGKEYTAEQVAGKSGLLTIRFKIEKNTACKGDFFEDYALQAAFILDGESCSNIIAPDATLANAGKNKQLTYTVLAGKGLDTVIKADVTDFEMEPVTINGLRLNIDVDIEDDQLLEKVEDLISAIEKVDDAAAGLSDGTVKTQDASGWLQGGVATFKEGLTSLETAITAMEAGTDTARQGLDTVTAGSGELTAASKEMQGAIDELCSGAEALNGAFNYSAYQGQLAANGIDVTKLAAANEKAINELNLQIASLKNDLTQLEQQAGAEEQTAALKKQIAGLEETVTLLRGNNGALEGTKMYFNSMSQSYGQLYRGLLKLKAGYGQLDGGIGEYIGGVTKLASGYEEILSGAAQLTAGSKNLYEGAEELYEGAGSLYEAGDSLYQGATQLSKATAKMRSQTASMDEKIKTQIDEMLNSLKGGSDDVKSFVSEKNTNVSSVQFAIKTASIEKKEADERPAAEAKELNLWQKLLVLFGL